MAGPASRSRGSECARAPPACRARSRLHPDRGSWAPVADGRARVVRRARARRAAAHDVRRRHGRGHRRRGRPRDLRRVLDGRAAVPAPRARPPRLVRALVLVERVARHRRRRRSAPRASSRRAARRRAWNATASHTFLASWLAQPMFASVPADAPGLADRRRLTPEFLAACLRQLGAGAMEPMWQQLRRARDAGAARDRHARREVHRDRAAHARAHASGRAPTCSSTAVTRCRSSNRRCSAV